MQSMQKYSYEKTQCPCENRHMDDEERNLVFPFVKWQKEPNMYDNLEEAYRIGTIFPELNFPFLGKRNRG